jgi:hypothetical protein
MQNRFTMFKRGNVFYFEDRLTGQQKSLQTRNDEEAKRIGMLQSQSTDPDSIVDHLAGGGVRTFSTDGTRDYKTARSFAEVTVGGSHAPALITPDGSQNVYGYSVGYLDGTTNYFLTLHLMNMVVRSSDIIIRM